MKTRPLPPHSTDPSASAGSGAPPHYELMSLVNADGIVNEHRSKVNIRWMDGGRDLTGRVGTATVSDHWPAARVRVRRPTREPTPDRPGPGPGRRYHVDVMVGTPELAPPSPDEATALDPDNRTYQPMSLRGPALAVLGIAVLIVVAGVVASAFGSGTSPNLSIRRITIPDGTVVGLTPATTAMRSIVSAGEPPADILGNLAVPSGSPVTRTLNVDQNAGQFDRTVSFLSLIHI